MAYENLQALMARAHMLKKDLAALLGRDNAVVTNLLKGGRPLSSEETKMLAQHFGVSTDTILDAAPLPAANALRALREQWKQLDKGAAPNHALWKRFDQACNRAYPFVQEWLEKAKAESQAHRDPAARADQARTISHRKPRR